MDEEEEIQAALLARRAQLAELRAAEKMLLNKSGSAAAVAAQGNGVKFISKDERDGKQQETAAVGSARGVEVHPQTKSTNAAVIVAPPQSQQPLKAVRNKQQQRGGGGNKRFQFDWDEAEDTSQDYYYYSAASAASNALNNDFKLVDRRQGAAAATATAIHATEKPLADMTERDWRIVREDFDIHLNLSGSRTAMAVPNPARNWEEMNLPPALLQRITQIGYSRPTPIQMQAIPIGIASAFDMIGQAETGSGKTAAFVIPLLVRLQRAPWAAQRGTCHENGPLGLILTPTRELAQQISQEISRLSLLNPCRSCVVVGGNSAEDQAFLLLEGVDVVVATPGRLLDLLSTRSCVLNHCSYIVLDEADRMIDMGFESQVNKVLDALVVGKQERTTLMFSATMDASVIRLAQTYMKQAPIIVRIGDEDTVKNKNIEQDVLAFTNEAAREQALMRIITAERGAPIIVFCNSKQNCDLLVRAIHGHRASQQRRIACALHSGRTQEEREENLRLFKEGVYQVLVATDVAGRGLDVEGVAHVVNYDCPTTMERYTHRIGRTGRAGKRGRATTFIQQTGEDAQLLLQLAKYLKQTKQAIPRDLREALGADVGEDRNIQD